jgi:hypothetical protein
MRNEIPQKVSESVRRRNPHLYGGNVVGQLEPKKRKQNKVAALESRPPRVQRGMEGVGILVTFHNHRKHIIDDDNLIGGLKHLRDAVAKSLGVDDGDPVIKFQYNQTETRGREGVIVHIERL